MLWKDDNEWVNKCVDYKAEGDSPKRTF